MKLLLIEDDRDDAELTLAQLRSYGFEIGEYRRVESAAGVIAAMREETWSAVISDYRMPGFNGIEALQIVREHDRDVPFIVISGSVREELAVEIIHSGANDYVLKDRLGRLGPSLERELRNVQLRQERRMFFEALHRSEDRYRRIFEQAPIGVATTTAAGGILAVNDRFGKMLGFRAADLIGQPLSRFAHADDRAAIASRQNGELRYVTCTGEVLWTNVTASVIVGQDQTVEQIVWLIEDISERKLQERELQRRAEQQTVVADIGSAALRGESIDVLVEEVKSAVSRLLGSDLCEILHETAANSAPMAAHALATGVAVISSDLAHDTRFAPPHSLRGRGMVSGIVAPIGTGRASMWGTVGAYFRDSRTFSVHEVEFLRAIATVLAQAIERDRVDQQLVLHASQQSAIANLSRIALKSVDDAMEIACYVAEDVLEVTHAAIFELDESAEILRFRAGRCGEKGELRLDGASPIAAAIRDTRASILDGAADGCAVASGMVAPVACNDGRFGVMLAHGKPGRTFIQADLEFLQSLANIVAEAKERERATRALAASEERYREVVEGASEMIFTISPEGRFLSLNGAFEQITGWAAADWLGRPFIDLVDDSDFDRGSRVLEAMCDRQEPAAGVLRIKGKHSEVLLDMTSFPKIEDGCTRTIYGFARDISERRKLEAQLEQANRLNSLGRMAATIAHEFNNVLMGISPFVEVIRRGKNVETSLEYIGRAVKRGKRVTEEILRFTRTAQLQLAPFHVEPWIENIALEGRSLIPPNCTIETFVQSPDFVIEGDANQLQQIFTNLILNARDAMPEGGTVSIEVLREHPNARLRFGVIEQPERYAHFIVRDTGSGMAPETLRHIFEPLFTTKKNGTGLGLAVVHQVVTRHGGEIFAESTAGVGTAFHIFLPLALPNAVVRPPERTQPFVAEPFGRQAPHVLLVEDDAAVSSGLVSVLEMQGLSVEVVMTGAGAIDAIEHVKPDVVVLDVCLPDMEGTNVYEAIAARMPSMPVIFSTGHADRARLDEYLEQPNVGYLLKPYESETLLRAIRDVLVVT